MARSTKDDTWLDVGESMISGGLVGGAFVIVNLFISREEEKRDLRCQLETGMEFPDINLTSSPLGGIYMPYRVLYMATLDDSDLRKAVLIFADLRWVSARRADFTEADMSGVNAEHATLTLAVLRDAVLDDVSLRNAVVRGGDLRGAVVRGGDLRGADFTGCTAAGAVFIDCLFDDAIMPDDIADATLDNPTYNDATRWSGGYTPPPVGTPVDADVAAMGLVEYLAYRKAVNGGR